MASVGFLIGGALISALAFSAHVVYGMGQELLF